MTMTTEQKFDLMARALPYAAELVDCTELKDAKEWIKKEDATTGAMMERLTPVFLSEKREAVMGLLGAVCGKTAQEVAAQDWEETKALMYDPLLEDVCDFFLFSVRMARNV